MKFRIKYVLLILLFISVKSFSQDNNVIVGDIAPKITFDKSFPSDYKIPKNKIIILDFWATWCGPCVASLIKTNELIDKYRDKIDFVAITDGTSKNIEYVIKNKKFNYNFIVDSLGQTHTKYGIKSIPAIIIISKNGTILWKGRNLTAPLLHELTTTGKICERITNKSQQTLLKESNDQTNKKYSIQINEKPIPNFEFDGMSNHSSDTIEMKYNMYLTNDLFEELKVGKSKLRISPDCKIPKKLSVDLYSVGIFKDINEAKKNILNNILNYLSIRAENTIEKTDVYIISVSDSLRLSQYKTTMTNKSDLSDSLRGGQYSIGPTLLNINLIELAIFIEQTFNVFCQTNIVDNSSIGYDFIDTKTNSLEEFSADLQNRFGLKIAKVKTEINYFQICKQ